jgi:hypothetical protein
MSEGKSSAVFEGFRPRRLAHAPSLSVIVLSEGSRDDLDRALMSIAPRCSSLGAEVIVVRQGIADSIVELNATHPGVIFLDAPKGSTSAAMREAGIDRASGDILALRMDGAVGDGRWLQAFDSTVSSPSTSGGREAARPLSPVVDDAIAARERRTPAGTPVANSGVAIPSSRERRSGQFEVTTGGVSAVAVREEAPRMVRHNT